MANTNTAILPKILARGLMSLREYAVMPRLVNGDYSREAAQKGDTIDVPIPVSMGTAAVVPSNTDPAPADREAQKVQIPLDQWRKNEPFHLTDKEMAEIDKDAHFVPMNVEEAVRALANEANSHIFSQYTGVYGTVFHDGSASSPVDPFSSTVLAATEARKLLNKQVCPPTNRRGVLDFDAEAAMLKLAQFSDVEKVGDRQAKIEGEVGRKFGTDWFADHAVPTHTAGTITTGLINKASTAVAVGAKTLVATTAASTGACDLKVGDIISIAGDDQQYVLTAAAVQASAATDVTLNFEPALKVALTGSENITVAASHTVNLVFHRDAFAFANRGLSDGLSLTDAGNLIQSLTDPVTGITLRLEVKRQYKQTVWEFDLLYGAKLVRPEFAVRVAGAV